MNNDKEYTCKMFSLALPPGSDRTDLPKLLERLADEIRTKGEIIPLNISFEDEYDESNDKCYIVTLYYDVAD